MSSERSFDAENPGLIHHSARMPVPQNDPNRQSNDIQPSRFARTLEASNRSCDDIEQEGLNPELVRPRSPTTILSTAAAPISAPEKPSSHGPSASSDPDTARTPFISRIVPPPSPLAPQMPAPDEFIPGLILPSHPQMPAAYFAPSRFETLSHNSYPSGIRSVTPASYNPGIESVPLPSKESPYSTYNPDARFPPPSRELPNATRDSGPHPVLQPSRQMLSNMYDSGPYSTPLRPLPQTPHANYARARRGDAFIPNDPFGPGTGKKEWETYDSFLNMTMPTDTEPTIAMSLPGVSSQPPVISNHVIPLQPPVLPSFIPSQPPVIMPIILPHRLSPIVTPTLMPPPQDVAVSEGVPIGSLSPILNHSPSFTFRQFSNGPVPSDPSEHPNDYGADLQDDSIPGQLPFSYPARPPGFIQRIHPRFTNITREFLTKTLPIQVYSHFLLRFPSLYFSRVARIFEEADLSFFEIKNMAFKTAARDMVSDDFYAAEFANAIPRQYTMFESRWESFIDTVLREWKTFNIISVFLLSAILTILQIQSAEQDPIIRYTALASSICALISLLFGCLYIIGFGSMRKPYKAAEWALEARTTGSAVWWNVWIFLAMPAIWLVWSIILYIACIMSFIWRTTTQGISSPLIMSDTSVLVIRVVLSFVLALGILYATLTLSTFRRYGEKMDKAWKKRVLDWIDMQKKSYYYQGEPVPFPYDSAPPSPVNPAIPAVAVPYVGAQPSPSPPLAPIGAPSQYPDSDHEIPSGYAPPSAREVSRNSSRRERKKGSAPYGPVFSSQEPHGSLPSSHLGDPGRQSISKVPDHEPSSALPQVPTRMYIPQADLQNCAQKQRKRRISVPPASNLPPISPTPGPSKLGYSTRPVFADSPPTTGESSPRLNEQNDATRNLEETEEPQQDSRDRVGFRQQTIQQPEPGQPSVDLPDAIHVQRQFEAQAERQHLISGSPPYVYDDPLYTYADPNAQAWAHYDAQGGKDSTGTVYFHFVPGVSPRRPAAAVAIVSQSQPDMEAPPTEQEQQRRQQQYDD